MGVNHVSNPATHHGWKPRLKSSNTSWVSTTPRMQNKNPGVLLGRRTIVLLGRRAIVLLGRCAVNVVAVGR